MNKEEQKQVQVVNQLVKEAASKGFEWNKDQMEELHTHMVNMAKSIQSIIDEYKGTFALFKGALVLTFATAGSADVMMLTGSKECVKEALIELATQNPELGVVLQGADQTDTDQTDTVINQQKDEEKNSD